MNKRNRIIVLVDLSEYSENLIEFAFNFAEHIDAKVMFVHQVMAIAPGMADQESRNEIINIAEAEASTQLRKLGKGRVYSDDAFHVSQKPILAILKELQSNHYNDWVLSGLKGTGIIKRILIGSIPLSIIDESDLLTVSIPVRTPISVPKKLMVGVYQGFPLNKHQFNTLLSSLAKQIHSVEFFTILKDSDDEGKARNHLLSLQKEYQVYNSTISLYKGEDKFDVLKNHVEHTEHTFLVLQQGSRSLRDKLFRKFMINELVYKAFIPLIVITK